MSPLYGSIRLKLSPRGLVNTKLFFLSLYSADDAIVVAGGIEGCGAALLWTAQGAIM